MTDTTAQIAAKGCNSTGITEDLAVALHNQLGKKVMAVVELVSESRSEKRDGKEKVTLSILTIEPAPNTDTEDHLRNLARSFHYERKLVDGQLQIETGDDLEPKVSDVLAAGMALEPHEYSEAPDDSNLGKSICDVCGQGKSDIRHDAKVIEDYGDEVPVDDEQPDEEPDDEEPARQQTNPFEVATT